MRILILDNKNRGARIGQWISFIYQHCGNSPDIKVSAQLSQELADDNWDALVIHYNDMEEANNWDCLLKGFADGNGLTDVVSLSCRDHSDQWFRLGKRIHSMLFFTGGGTGLYNEEFKKVINDLQDKHLTVSYVGTLEESQRRIKTAFGRKDPTALCEFNTALEAKLELLHKLLVPPETSEGIDDIWNAFVKQVNDESLAKKYSNPWEEFKNGDPHRYFTNPFDESYLGLLRTLRDYLDLR